jgi:hypothetical protein
MNCKKCLSAHLPISLSAHLPFCPSNSHSAFLQVRPLPLCLSYFLPVCLPPNPSHYLPVYQNPCLPCFQTARLSKKMSQTTFTLSSKTSRVPHSNADADTHTVEDQNMARAVMLAGRQAGRLVGSRQAGRQAESRQEGM